MYKVQNKEQQFCKQLHPEQSREGENAGLLADTLLHIMRFSHWLSWLDDTGTYCAVREGIVAQPKRVDEMAKEQENVKEKKECAGIKGCGEMTNIKISFSGFSPLFLMSKT